MPAPVDPGPDQESVWDYPRPPRLEPTPVRIRVVVGGVTLADSTHAFRVLETSHPPVYYLPPADVRLAHLIPVDGRSFCEWKGHARYFDIVTPRRIERAAWSYPDPVPAFAPIRDYLAFYASKVDECWVDEDRAVAQPGGFYGGWVTRNIIGPFKGEPGSAGW
jgi:uncharacterized protein (DUF427 family)